MKTSLEKLLVATLIILVIVVLIIGFLVVHQIRASRDTGDTSSSTTHGSGKVQIKISPELINESQDGEGGTDG